MIAKNITYTDYNGESRTETFYFNFSKAELIDMNYSVEGGLEEVLKKIVREKNTVEIAKTFKDFILRSVGEKSADGKRFIKVRDDGTRVRDSFEQTEAFSELYMELFTDPSAGAEFFKGIIPASVAEQVKKLEESKDQ